jgi:hypothetical protein
MNKRLIFLVVLLSLSACIQETSSNYPEIQDFAFLERGISLESITEQVGNPNVVSLSYPSTYTFFLADGEKVFLVFQVTESLDAAYIIDSTNGKEWIVEPPTYLDFDVRRDLSDKNLSFIRPEMTYRDLFVELGPPNDYTSFGEGDLLIYAIGQEGRLLLRFKTFECLFSAKFSPYSFNDDPPEFIDLFEPSEDYCK